MRKKYQSTDRMHICSIYLLLQSYNKELAEIAESERMVLVG